ncbi:MAG: histidine--tRNA ligase [Candidatus Coatesbacteria bacterium]|nr:histidine--tRNA ligase [Candidatus Coatesbacteria bacterium]
MNLNPPQGMRDFYPEDMLFRNYLFDKWREISRIYGFEEFDAPIVESADLFRRKSGEEIDEQIYVFKDKGGRELALRPELTPSLARLILSRIKELHFPLRWFGIVQCFRYERAQKGRKREHYQWNVDIIGEESPIAESEVIAAAVNVMTGLGMTSRDFKVRIGHRGILHDILKYHECEMKYFNQICLALDKRGKIADEAIKEMLKSDGLPESEIQKIFKIMEIRNIEEIESIIDNKSTSLNNLKELFNLLEIYNLKDFIEFDIGIIRGLAYYTGIVFEGFDVERKYRAIFGGGRYNNLLQNLGGKDLPAVGLGFGDVVIKELLEYKNMELKTNAKPDIAIAFLSDNERDFAIKIAELIRKKGISTDLFLKPEKPKKIFSLCNKMKKRFVILIGENEKETGSVTIKDMNSGIQEEVAINDIIKKIAP